MKYSTLVGRKNEVSILKDALESNESELISVIGRRRVGKTFLVQTTYRKDIDFEITGIQHASKKEQLENFAIVLNLYTRSPLPIAPPSTWLEAFRLLILYLERIKKDRKRIIFFDELPWLASHKSGFLKAFGFFWNSWAVKNQVVVVICGSAASWMIQKVVHDKGGLYNRITKRIRLRPFTLFEVESFLQERRIIVERYQIVELYMVTGGIPHYLKEIRKGESVAQNIDRICFDSSNGMLYDEFQQLYPSLFDRPENHIAIIHQLAARLSGHSRKEISDSTGIPKGGGLSKTLSELLQSDFISEYLPFGKKKRELRYRLTDEYSLFYLKFIQKLKHEGLGIWKNFSQTPTYNAWSGYAFENICLKHLPQIKQSLGISGIYSTHSSYYHPGSEDMDGCQIDLLIDRNDKIINLFEIKFSSSEFILTKSYAKAINRKIALFKYYAQTKKQIFLTFITPFGLLPNEQSKGWVDKELSLDDLFLP
ncbi:MAG: ATP-binding protein [Bacteroidota bacterium]